MATRTGKGSAKKLPAKKRPAKTLKKAAARKTPVNQPRVTKTIGQKTALQKVAIKKARPEFRVDLAEFPPESVVRSERSLCVACVWQIFTQAMNMTPKAALTEIRRYTPSFEELTSEQPVRPFFAAPRSLSAKDKDPCPYCGAPAKWHAHIETHRIE